MLEFRSSEQTYVRRMRVAASRGDALAASLRVQSLFASAQLSPSWLAPSAILCIRRLRAATSHALARDAPRLPAALHGTLLSEIERLARAAARPARGIVAADAESVVFADRAELLASLAADCCDRLAGTRWWWRSLFKETPDRRALPKMFGAQTEYVPAALAQLARLGKAADFAASLSDSDARSLLLRVTRKFELRELASSLVSAFDEAAPAHDSEASRYTETTSLHVDSSRDDSTRTHRASSVASSPSNMPAPWIGFAPESKQRELSAAAQSLLGVGLTLARAPAAARELAFARRTFNWLRRQLVAVSNASHANPEAFADARTTVELRQSPSPRHAHPATRAHNSGAQGACEVEPRAQQDRQSSENVSDAPPLIAHDTAAGKARESKPLAAAKEQHSRGDAQTSGARVTRSTSSAPGATTEQSRTRVARAARDDDAGAREARDERRGSDARGESGARVELPDDARSDDLLLTNVSTQRERAVELIVEGEIETRFGGLFFLLNVALFLNLYGDFTAPKAYGLPLSPWDFIALVGRKLAGENIRRDEVWSLLARLAGRAESDAAGEGFEPADEWRVPVEWLKTFSAEGDWLWSHARGRLRVRHPAGFFILDLPSRAEEVRRLLSREMLVYIEACSGVHLRRADKTLRARGRNARERWLERLTEYIRARLGRALGATGARRLSHLLIERRARVFVTASHLDVVMRLAELPVEVRFAGLDRDLGWLPAAGRHIAFHFE